MTHMPQNAPTAPAGRRKMTHAHLAARAGAQAFQGRETRLPGHYIGALKRAAPMLGIGRRVIDFVDTLFAYSQKQDWEDGRPVVWPSNDTLMDTLCLSRSGVQYLIRAAVEAGLVLMEDSPNGRRYGYRDGAGNITRAYGFNLTPLAARFDEFTAAFEAHKALRLLRRSLRARATHLRNDILSLADLGARSCPGGADWKALTDRAGSLWLGSRPVRDTGLLEPCVTALRQLRDEAAALLDEASMSVKTKPMGFENKAHNTTTNHLPVSKETTTPTPKPGNSVGRQGGPMQPEEEESREGVHDHAADPSRNEHMPAALEKSSESRHCGVLHSFQATPQGVLDIAPALRGYITSPHPGWPELADAARVVAGTLGISQHAWGEACMTLGRTGAVLALAAISARYDKGEVQSAGGFLRALTDRHQKGELHLDRTLYSLAKRTAH